jgi:hypothetical protein
LSGNTAKGRAAKVGDLLWVHLPVAVPSNVRIKKVVVYYRVSNERSYISQVRLKEEQIPPTALVLHDDGVALKSTKGASYESRLARP